MTIAQSKIQQARSVDLVEYCDSKGFDMKYKGDGNCRLPGYSGLIIKDNYFKQFGSNKRGNSIDFCVDILGMEFKAAVKELLSFGNEKKEDGKTIPIANAMGAGLKRKNTICELPTMAANNQKVIDYLTKRRGIQKKLVNGLIDDGLIYQDSRNNCVFTCYDQSGQARGAILRGTLADKPFKGRSKGSDVDYGWLLAPIKESSQVIITEAPIDALSMIALYDESIRDRYILALGGLHESAVKRFLESHTGVDKIILAVDNDDPATEFINKIKNSLDFAYHIKEFRPEGEKDWNEVLLAS